MDEVKVQISAGEVVIRKPTAGMRNKAIAVAETPDGIRNTVLITELLPMCIGRHPWGAIQLRPSLDALSIEDYDKCVTALAGLLKPVDGDVGKKSETPSEEEGTPKKGG